MVYLLGLDIGSSSVKACLLNADTGRVAAQAVSPAKEMAIQAPQPGWAEQNPALWWKHVKLTTAALQQRSGKLMSRVQAIGISYQMHGLVAVDRKMSVLRPAIIWCDSRAVFTGSKAAQVLGGRYCRGSLLNMPGNFTASKLAWVRENEPQIYKRIHKIMLPGDYIAMKMTGEIATTVSGLSEGIFWDFNKSEVSTPLLEAFGLNGDLLASQVDTFGVQGELHSRAAADLGLPKGIPVSYRAGDQPNNAFSLAVLQPGEIAATAGTSGVVYGVGDKPSGDPGSRVNTFVHVNHSSKKPRYGTLMCVNGTGILNSWLKANLNPGLDYPKMNQLAAKVPPGSEGLTVLPYGNGAERTLSNRETGACVNGLGFNRHTKAHLYRGAQEGIAFALNYGLGIMRDMGISIKAVKAGKANMFLSPVFREAFVNTTGATLQLYETDGAGGAARGAGIGTGIYRSYREAFQSLTCLLRMKPDRKLKEQYAEAYARWCCVLKNS